MPGPASIRGLENATALGTCVERVRIQWIDGNDSYTSSFRPDARPCWLNRFSSGRPPERGDQDQRERDSAHAISHPLRGPRATSRCRHIRNYKVNWTLLTSRRTP